MSNIPACYFEAFNVSWITFAIKQREDHMPNLTITHCNEIFLKQFKCERGDVIGRPLARFFTQETYGNNLQFLYMSMKMGEKAQTQLSLQTNDGQLRIMDTSAFQVKQKRKRSEASISEKWCWVLAPCMSEKKTF